MLAELSLLIIELFNLLVEFPLLTVEVSDRRVILFDCLPELGVLVSQPIKHWLLLGAGLAQLILLLLELADRLVRVRQLGVQLPDLLIRVAQLLGEFLQSSLVVSGKLELSLQVGNRPVELADLPVQITHLFLGLSFQFFELSNPLIEILLALHILLDCLLLALELLLGLWVLLGNLGLEGLKFLLFILEVVFGILQFLPCCFELLVPIGDLLVSGGISPFLQLQLLL